MRRVLRAGVLVALALGVGAVPGAAQEGAAPDSLGEFLRALADSTDAYFGPSSAAVDTAGLGSSLATALRRPWLRPRRRAWLPSLGPWFSFNRVDGPLWGGTVGLGRQERGVGEIRGRLGYIAGPNQWRGGGAWRRRWHARDRDLPAWRVEIAGGRSTDLLDADGHGSWLRVARALIDGSDHQDYLRRDGAGVHIGRDAAGWRIGTGFRAQLESPLTTTTTWNLLDHIPEAIPNAGAAYGRVRAVELEVATQLPHLPLRLETSGELAAIGLGSDLDLRRPSDFDYRRVRARLAGDIGLGRVLSLVPELEYGRLAGDALPQVSFFLGGSANLRSLETRSYAGTGRTLARLDMIFAPDLLSLAHLPHPPFLPIQGGLFAGSGAVWGRDPFGGPGSAENGWPDRGAWRSEVGVSLLYRPGLPDPSQFLRIDYARAVGPGSAAKVSIYFSAPLDIVRLPQ